MYTPDPAAAFVPFAMLIPTVSVFILSAAADIGMVRDGVKTRRAAAASIIGTLGLLAPINAAFFALM